MRIMRWLAATAVGSIIGMGCATLQYPDRWDFGTFRMIVATPEQVSSHCHWVNDRYAKRTGITIKHDSGTAILVDEELRACTDRKTPAKPTIFISKKWRRCAPHEDGHAQYVGPDELMEAMRPCLGEGKR